MKRIITALVGILILIPVCIFYDSILCPICVCFFAFMAIWELFSCIGLQKHYEFLIPSLLLSLSPLVVWGGLKTGIAVEATKIIFVIAAAYILVMLLLSVFCGNKVHSEKLFAAIGMSIFTVFSFTALSRLSVINRFLFYAVFLGAWFSDTMAFAIGSLFAKRNATHKLCPAISPKKSVEGAIGGILGNAVVFFVYGLLVTKFSEYTANLVSFTILGAVLAIVGQFGDLFFSCIKRSYGIKDFGKLFPGHGGSLDRFDSALVVADVLYLFKGIFGAAVFFIR